MPNEQTIQIKRIKQIEREFLATQFATIRLLTELNRDPSILPLGTAIQPRDVRQALLRLDSTYIIRVFAEFETGLRHYWAIARETNPPYRTQDLMDGVAARNRIAVNQRENAHAVRRHRNNVLHFEVDPETEDSLTVSAARQHLCQFLSYLPRHWQ